MKSSSGPLPQVNRSRSWVRSSRSIFQSVMTPGVLFRRASKGGIRLGRVVEQVQESVTIPVGERGRRLLIEADLGLGNDHGLADADLRVAHLLHDDRGVGEGLGETDPALRVGRTG